MTFTGRDSTDGHFHLDVIAQPLGTFRIKDRAQPTPRFPPLLPDMAVPPLRATAAATSVRGVTPRSLVACACTHHRTSARVGGPRERPGGIATPQTTPVPSNPGTVDRAVYAFHFRRTGFDRWTFSPGCDSQAHRYTSDQGPGTTHTNSSSVTARRGRSPPPCDGGGDVSEGVHTTEPRAVCLHPPPHFRTCRRAQRKTRRHSYPPKLHPSRQTQRELTGRSTPLTFAGRGLTDVHFHLGVIAKHIGTLWIKVRA